MNNNDEKINNTEIREAIIKVVAFFDMFDYSLTSNEIWQNLYVKCELLQIMEVLEKSVKPPLIPPFEGGQKIESKNGFYFLAGREAIVEERLRRYNFTDRKFKRALFAAGIFKFIPWIKMMAVGNLIGAHNLKNDSDIDFFIIAEDKKIWLTRFFCVSLAKFLGFRPRAGDSRDKVCLSFYASDQAMDLRGLMLPQDSIGRWRSLQNDNINDDIYFIYWLAGLTPIYDVGGVYEKLIKANQWLNHSLPNWRPRRCGARQRQAKPLLWGFYHDAVDLFFGGLEPQFKKLQLRLLPLELRNLINLDSRVVVNDQIIKLHANDRREEYREKYEEKINNLL